MFRSASGVGGRHPGAVEAVDLRLFKAEAARFFINLIITGTDSAGAVSLKRGFLRGPSS
jgi:hypothetical protein